MAVLTQPDTRDPDERAELETRRLSEARDSKHKRWLKIGVAGVIGGAVIGPSIHPLHPTLLHPTPLHPTTHAMYQA